MLRLRMIWKAHDSRPAPHLTWQVDAEAEEAGARRPGLGSQRAGQKTRPRLDYEERRRRVGPARAPRCGQVSISRTILLHMAGKMSPACPPELPNPSPQPRFTWALQTPAGSSALARCDVEFQCLRELCCSWSCGWGFLAPCARHAMILGAFGA